MTDRRTVVSRRALPNSFVDRHVARAGCRVVALALVLLRAPGAPGGDWPQFRGPNGGGVSDERGLPVEWGPDRSIRWKAPLPGQGHSNPVIAGGRVFVTASSGFWESRLHVL